MKRIKKENSVFSMNSENKPVEFAKSGERVIFETYDCFSNQIKTTSNLLSSIGWDSINPATGPLFIENAEPGDILKVEIIDITLDSQCVLSVAPGFGTFGHILTEEKTKIMPLSNNKVIFNNNIELDIAPMIGVIGTAPANNQNIPTGTPGNHGGNTDNKRITKGSILYYPVNVPGALLAMGDMHAIMADGEVAICGAEISGEITVECNVIKNTKMPTPMLISNNMVITVASAPTLDNAAQIASENMLSFVVEATGMDIHEVSMLLSLQGNLRICQIVDPEVTVRMEFPKWILEKYGYIFP